MAFLIKDSVKSPTTGSGVAVLEQWIHVKVAGRTIPATTTDQIFRVYGGRVLVKALVGEVTTIIQTQLDNLKVSSKKLSDASAAVGTAVDLSANVDITAREVGGLHFVEGDGTA